MTLLCLKKIYVDNTDVNGVLFHDTVYINLFIFKKSANGVKIFQMFSPEHVWCFCF